LLDKLDELKILGGILFSRILKLILSLSYLPRHRRSSQRNTQKTCLFALCAPLMAVSACSRKVVIWGH